MAPASWLPADEQLLQRVVQHFQAAVVEGSLPSLRAAQGIEVAPQEWQWLLPLHRLLLAHLAAPAPDLLAEVFACACMGSHHLWQDLGLSGRDDVSRLMQLAFPALFQANQHNLRWKRHLFLCLGQSLDLSGLKPPKCDQCELFASCMGSPAPAMAVIRTPPARLR